MYVMHQRPFKSKQDLIFEIYNEITLLSISYFLIVFIEIIDDTELRYDIGWYMVIISLLNIAVNWLNLVATLVWTIV